MEVPPRIRKLGRPKGIKNMPTAENVGRPRKGCRPPQKQAATKDSSTIKLSTDATNRIHAPPVTTVRVECQSSDYLIERCHNDSAPNHTVRNVQTREQVSFTRW